MKITNWQLVAIGRGTVGFHLRVCFLVHVPSPCRRLSIYEDIGSTIWACRTLQARTWYWVDRERVESGKVAGME